MADIPPYNQYILPISVQIQSAFQYWHAHGNIDADCAIDNVGIEWRCYVGKYDYNYISTPLFVYNSQYDEDALLILGAFQPYDKSELEYREQYRGEIVNSLSQENITYAFVPISQEHAISVHPESQTLEIHGESLQDMLGPWFFNLPGIPKLIQYDYITYAPLVSH